MHSHISEVTSVPAGGVLMPGWFLKSPPRMLVWLSVYANHPWSVTEPEAVGVPGCQKGTKALCLYSQSPQACKPVHRALTWLTTALVECNALRTILAPVQAVCEGESGALYWAFWEVFWELTLASLKSLLSTTMLSILRRNFHNGWLDLIFKMLSASINFPLLSWLVSSLEYCFQK